MNLTSGELYFIRETDVLTKSETAYVKIGLVKDLGDRTSEARAAEHQTGNPRLLHVANVVKTHAISEVENIVHKLFAPWRVSGEWFHFDSAQLASAIETAEQLAREISDNIDALKSAADLKETLSVGDSRQPNSEVSQAFMDYHIAELKVKRCSEVVKKVKEVLRTALEKGEDVGYMATLQQSAPRETFDSAALAEEYPKLYAEYVFEEESFSGRFTVSKAKDLVLNLSDLDPGLVSFADELEKMLKDTKFTKLSMERMFDEYLRLLGFQARAELDKEIAATQIQVACSTSPEIEGVCKWGRAMKEMEVFDQEGFIEAHPKIAQKFVSVSQPAPVFKIATKHAYSY